jgi:hypothetical protein
MKQVMLFALLFASLAGFSQVAKPVQSERKQCQETTTKGKRCLNPANPGTDYCYCHDKSVAHCGDDIPGKIGGRTAKKLPCKNKVSAKGDRCYRHAWQK